MPPSIDIIQSVEYDIETRKPLHRIWFVLNICVIGYQFCIWPKLLSNLFCYQSLWFLDVFVSEEELTVEVAEIDGI